MSKVTYNLQLKGYVGGADFDRTVVDSLLADNDGKPVNVLIDSLGGQPMRSPRPRSAIALKKEEAVSA